ncbi:MAG: protein translocase SEC61 complex subunit gamma [Candidatus Thermoplasmatota archaeon]|nr:protein translocase SEC61 complex subunit gamma [Candidatus Thermoplasmatota archaeon]
MSKAIDRAWEIQYKIEKKTERLGKGKYGRVLKMARNPESEEYIKTSQMAVIGIAIIGIIGFAIYLLAAKVAPWIGDLIGL